ncbi:hypothetical protein D3C73_1110060 [compost metagenome]
MPGVSAVDFGSLVNVLRNSLQGCDIDDHVIAHKPPQPGRGKRVVDESGGTEPAGFAQLGQPDAVQEQIQRALCSIKYIAEHEGYRNAIHNVGQEQEQPEAVSSAQPAVQHHGEIYRHDVLD